MGKYIVGITGATGSIYAERLIRKLLNMGHEVHICITRAGLLVARSEVDWAWDDGATPQEIESALQRHYGSTALCYYDIDSIGARIASGSFRTDGMVVAPCSMGTLSAIANGASHNLLERAADVVLKERGRLVLVVRETPFNSIHLQNMLTLSQCGTVIMPACPSFYNKPASLEELADFFAARVLDQMGLHDDTIVRWDGL